MLLQYINIIFLPHGAIYFVKCSSPSYNKAQSQHDAATSVLHSCDGVLRPASLPLSFSSKHNNGHYIQTVLFLFHQPRGHFSKKYDLCRHGQLQNVVWLFYGGFGPVASSLLNGLSGFVNVGLVLLWI